MDAILALEDGQIYRGRSFGASGERCGEVVFNTSMTGYQEILTDPSYKGQIVAMTYPLIGNCGVNNDDVESGGVFVEGFVVKECSKIASNWRSCLTLPDYLKAHGVVAIEGIDTRSLTVRIRQSGELKAVISTEDLDAESLVRKARASRGLIGVDLVREVASKRRRSWNAEGRFRVVVLDCGLKFNIARHLAKNSCRVTIMPARAESREILDQKPDGVLLSNGPGDPAAVPYVVKTVRALIGKVPIFGICLGHQMLGQALGAATYKLKFGHHGGNHPVKDLKTGRVAITVQNHGFCVDIGSLGRRDVEMTHINLNDQTLEGMRHRKLPVFSVQFHPESSPGPHDAEHLFNRFVELMKSSRRR